MIKGDVIKVFRALGTALVLSAVSISCSDPFAPQTAPSSAPFAVNYTVRAAAVANGNISPSGAVTVSAGSGQAFTITPDASFQVADVQVDGASVGAVTSFTFTNVVANHTITATFSPSPLSGLFSGTMTLGTVSGGECVGASLSTRGGSTELSTLSINFVNTTDIRVSTRSISTGLQCSYTGNASAGFFSAAGSCGGEQLFQCVNGAGRFLAPINSTITGNVTGNNTIAGNVATTYSVFDPEHKPIGALVVQQQFTAVRQ
jgi:hypothetical protein